MPNESASISHRAGRPSDLLLDEASNLLLRLKRSPDDRAAQAEAAAWQRRSAAHARAWMAAQKIWALTGAIGADHPVFNPQPGKAGWRLRTRPTRRQVAGAAVAAMAACLAIIAAPAVLVRWQADYATATGETRIVTLDDGSRVELGAGTAIAVIDDTGRRGVELLSGRAWFEVAKDPARPFEVLADTVTVTVTGTQFDVGLSDTAVDVALAEGAVRADFQTVDGAARRALRPGERLHVDRIGRSAELARVPIGSIAAWRRGKLLVEDATIGEIVEDIRPYYSGVIVLSDEALAQRRVTGTFDLRNPVEALRAVVEPHAGRVRRISPWVLVLSSS